MELGIDKSMEEEIKRDIKKREKKDYCVVYELLHDERQKKERLKFLKSMKVTLRQDRPNK